uniref:Reverse transcriptase domain-containing protein n=1 Tax=Trichogramma kaykai TaxID=54128 RepID=A0ABD2X0M4_9HYME
MSAYLTEHQFLDAQQRGFQPLHSTQTVVDKRMTTLLVSFDFSKAFDVIDHLLLIRKLRAIDFTDITYDHRALLYDYFLSLDRADWTNRCMTEGLVLVPPALELLPPTKRA